MMLWCKDAPQIGVDPDKAIIQYINKVCEKQKVSKMNVLLLIQHITCAMPSPTKSPDLYALVDRYQRHRCSGTCTKGKRKYCRFGFPRRPSAMTWVNNTERALRQRRGKGVLSFVCIDKQVQYIFITLHISAFEKIYTLRRDPECTNINDYSPAVLLAWRANIDCQVTDFILTASVKFIAKKD
jgi:hypothetical protein